MSSGDSDLVLGIAPVLWAASQSRKSHVLVKSGLNVCLVTDEGYVGAHQNLFVLESIQVATALRFSRR